MRASTLRIALRAALPALLLVAVPACVTQSSIDPQTCSQPSIHIDATLAESGKLQPERLDVCREQRVVISVVSKRAGELHLHGYDDQRAEIQLSTSAATDLAFTATHPGQFVLELHPADGSDEVEVGVLTVHER